MKYEVGDRVRIKSIEWYNRRTNGTEIVCGEYPFTSDMKEFCGQERIIVGVCQDCYFLLGIEDKFVFTDEMIEGLVEEEICTGPDIYKDGYIHGGNVVGNEITLPEGYIFKDENDNVINAQKIVLEKKKKEYPKTYEECCKVMNYCCNPGYPKTIHKEELIRRFQFLLLYRDAYWKIAGEEMGLGKPWEPNWTSFEGYPAIYTYRYQITLSVAKDQHHCLVFPTEEMRDDFKENFDPDIEFCKELL